MSAVERVRRAYAKLTFADPAVFISVRDRDDALAAAARVDEAAAAGVSLPLAGLVGALKDNIDLSGLPTTAGCPAFAYLPERSARCAERLEGAGLVIIGKTNLDQFATGLVGTRSPYGALRSVLDDGRIAGGSSSGSAVAVASGVVDLALGTDTAGSGRVPAAFNGIVGLKPTRGLVSVRGVVPACASFDCVSLFARDVATALAGFRVIALADDEDPLSRRWITPPARPVDSLRIGVARPDDLEGVTSSFRSQYVAAIEALRGRGFPLSVLDIGEMLATGRLLYEGALVAERYAAVGPFIEAHPEQVDPSVREIILGARSIPAHELVRDELRVAAARRDASRVFDRVDVIVLPTVPEHPTGNEVAADPIGVNRRLGRFTTFCNLLDLSAIAIPPPGPLTRSGFGLTLLGPPFADELLAGLAASLRGETVPEPAGPPGSFDLLVLGAHLSGQPLNHQLTTRGARLVGGYRTADCYRLYALPTEPPRPGLVRVERAGGREIEAELWRLEGAGFADFVSLVPPPLAIGQVELSDGRVVPGFVLAATSAPSPAQDITEFGGWRAYLGAPHH